MVADLLPPLLAGGSVALIFALGIALVALHTTLLASASRRTALEPRKQIAATVWTGALLAIWLAVGLMIADRAHFQLVSSGLRLPVVLLVGFGPVAALVALLFTSKAVGEINRVMPPDWLIWAQTYRIAGWMFLYPFLYYGVIPAGFAVPAALGDFFTGAVAPLVAFGVFRRRQFGWAIAWNIFGLLDLIAAPIAALLSGARIIDLYPLVLVPLFIGPPLGILTHIYSLRNLAVATHQTNRQSKELMEATCQA